MGYETFRSSHISSKYTFFSRDVISQKTDFALKRAIEASVSVKSSDGVTTFPSLMNGSSKKLLQNPCTNFVQFPKFISFVIFYPCFFNFICKFVKFFFKKCIFIIENLYPKNQSGSLLVHSNLM